MTAGNIGIRRKAMAKPQARARGRLTLIAVAAVIAIVFLLGIDKFTGAFGIFGPGFEVVETPSGRILRVPPGGDLQSAVDHAQSGDIVELQAGAVYFGEIRLPNKPFNDFVTIRTSAVNDLPEGKRVNPSQVAAMARIVTPGKGKPAVSAQGGANHFRFVGIEFAPANDDYIYNLILFGNGESAADLPHDLEIDRSYLHPFRSGVTRRGIALNSAKTVVKNSYIEGFGYPSQETQGICGWTGTRNIEITNNYIEGGAENIMFGGSDPASADLIPADIIVTGNHLNKPAEWRGKASLKTLFELKNARRVKLIGNLMTNNWVGSAFRITIRNQDGGATFSTVEDVEIRDNVIDGAGDGMNILGKDDTHPSQVLRHLVVENNLFLNITNGRGFEGSGYLIQIADGEDILIANNTAFNTGNIVTFYGTLPRSFVFRENIAGHGEYGVHGPIDLRSQNARAMFQNNVFMNLNAVAAGDYAFPPGNSIVSNATAIGFTDIGSKNYDVSAQSKFRGKGSKIPSEVFDLSK